MMKQLSLKEIQEKYASGNAAVSSAILRKLQRDPRAGARQLYKVLARRYEEQKKERNRLDAMLHFERLIEADRLPEIKRQTNQLEEELAPLLQSVKRPVNLDPGYIEQAKVILASTKNFYHRIYLGRGIFGEVTMHFKNNTFQFFPWTYPDYQSKDYQEFFLKLRHIYRSQLRTMCIIKQEE